MFLAEKGGSRTLRGPYGPQTGFEDQRHHRAPSFSSPAKVTNYQGIAAETNGGNLSDPHRKFLPERLERLHPGRRRGAAQILLAAQVRINILQQSVKGVLDRPQLNRKGNLWINAPAAFNFLSSFSVGWSTSCVAIRSRLRR